MSTRRGERGQAVDGGWQAERVMMAQRMQFEGKRDMGT